MTLEKSVILDCLLLVMFSLLQSIGEELVMPEKGSIETEIFGLSSLSYIFFASVHR